MDLKLVIVAGVSLLLASGCEEKKDKTCSQEGDSGGTLGAPWKELGVGDGEICTSSATTLKFIVKGNKNSIDVSTKVADQLKAKGFEPVEGTLNMVTSGEGKDANTDIYGWEFKKGDKTIDLAMSSYPPSIWKDDPVSITLTMK